MTVRFNGETIVFKQAQREFLAVQAFEGSVLYPLIAALPLYANSICQCKNVCDGVFYSLFAGVLSTRGLMSMVNRGMRKRC